MDQPANGDYQQVGMNPFLPRLNGRLTQATEKKHASHRVRIWSGQLHPAGGQKYEWPARIFIKPFLRTGQTDRLVFAITIHVHGTAAIMAIPAIVIFPASMRRMLAINSRIL